MPDVRVTYHGEIAQKKQKQSVHPMTKLKNFIERQNIRLLDFFNMLDTDHSMSISRQEFAEGIEVRSGGAYLWVGGAGRVSGEIKIKNLELLTFTCREIIKRTYNL